MVRKNQVLVDLDSDILSLETVDRVKGFDGVSLSQQIELDETVYKNYMIMALSKLLREVLDLIVTILS